MKERKLFTKSDLVIIAVIAVAVLILLIPGFKKGEKLTAVIYSDGEVIKTIDLNDVDGGYDFSPGDGTVIRVENGRICFFSAVCNDKICIKSGWLTRNGQTAACLPERIVISIVGDQKTPDILTY